MDFFWNNPFVFFVSLYTVLDLEDNRKEPGIEIGLGFFALFCDRSFYAVERKRGISGKLIPFLSIILKISCR